MNKNLLKRFFGIASLVVFVALLSGCEKKYRHEIEGTWTITEAVYTDFDGIQTDISEYGGIPVGRGTEFTFADQCHIDSMYSRTSCSYEVDKDSIVFITEGDDNVEMEYWINGNTMELNCIYMLQQSQGSEIEEETIRIKMKR